MNIIKTITGDTPSERLNTRHITIVNGSRRNVRRKMNMKYSIDNGRNITILSSLVLI